MVFPVKASRRIPLLLILLLPAGILLWNVLGRRDAPGPSEAPLFAWVDGISDETRANRPNILLVVYDARRRDDFSFGPFGNKRGDTPFLAAFKDDAVFFEDAVAPGCWTVPVHASMFSGLSVCDLGIDFYNPGYAAFGTHFLSLPEIMTMAGYHTIAYPDHPYFYNQNPDVALVRGFEQFNVINDFRRYASYSNIGTEEGVTDLRERLGARRGFSRDELREAIEKFNRGEIRFDLGKVADFDPVNELYLPRLYNMYMRSPYFRKRYGEEFEKFVFTDASGERPYFLFLNLHMCTIAYPDPRLFFEWYLKALMLNAQHRSLKLAVPEANEGVRKCLGRNVRRLNLQYRGFTHPSIFLKHVFDNRFYDATFRAVWEYLEQRGLTRNTVTLVTSDHGLGFSEKGERFYFHSGARPHEYMTRVPLVLRFPLESEFRSLHGHYTEKTSLTDIFTTIVNLGVGENVFRRPLPVRGRSLMHRIRRKDFEKVFVSESALQPQSYRQWPGVAAYSKAIYSGSMKLIYAPEPYQLGGLWPKAARLGPNPEGPDSPPPHRRLRQPLALLYDLDADPLEERNLASERPEKVLELQGLAEGNWACKPIEMETEEAVWDDEALETLRSLGYIQ